MKALLLSALLVAGLLTGAAAQQAVGPVAITNTVNGIPVTVSATSWVTTNPVGNELRVQARIFFDLIDLQKKFASVVGSFKLPANKCNNRGPGSQNPVVSFKSGSLWPVDDRLVMSVRGDVDAWSCVAGPQKSAIEWRKKKVWFLKVKLPERHTWRTMKERKDGAQSFSGSMPIQLVKKDDANISLKIAESDIKLEGQEASATNSNASLAKHINQKAYNALQSAIDPAKLKMALPKELQKLNMTVVSTRFRSYGGHAIAEINLAAAGAPYTQ
jgi:hypothetical protein